MQSQKKAPEAGAEGASLRLAVSQGASSRNKLSGRKVRVSRRRRKDSAMEKAGPSILAPQGRSESRSVGNDETTLSAKTTTLLDVYWPPAPAFGEATADSREEKKRRGRGRSKQRPYNQYDR